LNSDKTNSCVIELRIDHRDIASVAKWLISKGYPVRSMSEVVRTGIEFLSQNFGDRPRLISEAVEFLETIRFPKSHRPRSNQNLVKALSKEEWDSNIRAMENIIEDNNDENFLDIVKEVERRLNEPKNS
jgi:hypothetical protein